MSQKIIGIDPSINSTGVCVISLNNTKKNTKYYLIQPDNYLSKKKTESFESITKKYLIRYTYTKLSNEGSYSQKEYNKSLNILSIINNLKVILKKEKPSHAYMEGVSYGSIGSAALVDLSGLNFCIRCLLDSLKIPFTIVSPTELKKFTTGNGAAQKDEMIYCWLNCDSKMTIYSDFKIDDCADAYFLASYNN